MAEDNQDSFEGLEASSLFCPVCDRANPVQSKLLLCLPAGDKIGLYCTHCGTEVGSKMVQTQPGAN